MRRTGASQEVLQGLACVTIFVEMVEKARDGVGNFRGGATVADGTSDGSDLADAAANAEIIGVDHLPVVLDFFAFDADVGDPVLAAGVGAAGDVEAQILLVVGKPLFELLGEPAGEGLGFGESEFAEFGAGTGDGAAGEGRSGVDEEAGSVEFADDVMDVAFRNVDEQKILHGSVADMAVGVAVGEISGETKLRGSDAPANDGSANREDAGLLLRDDAEMVAMDARREAFGFGGIESEPEFFVQSGEEGVGGPIVFQEQEFEASFLAGLAKDLGLAKDFGDSADDPDDLLRLDEGIQTKGEMRLRREAAADANGKAKFVSREP